MYITEDELKKRLNKTDIKIVERTRKERTEEKRLSHDDRVIIGILSEVDTQKNIADLVGVSQTTVSNVSRGLVAPSSGVDKELKEEVKEGIDKIAKDKLENEKKIQDQLITNLAAALGHVANNMHSTDASEASKIAVDMSRILSSVSGSDKDGGGRSRTAIIINVPAMKEEKHYQTIEV